MSKSPNSNPGVAHASQAPGSGQSLAASLHARYGVDPGVTRTLSGFGMGDRLAAFAQSRASLLGELQGRWSNEGSTTTEAMQHTRWRSTPERPQMGSAVGPPITARVVAPSPSRSPRETFDRNVPSATSANQRPGIRAGEHTVRAAIHPEALHGATTSFSPGDAAFSPGAAATVVTRPAVSRAAASATAGTQPMGAPAVYTSAPIAPAVSESLPQSVATASPTSSDHAAWPVNPSEVPPAETTQTATFSAHRNSAAPAVIRSPAPLYPAPSYAAGTAHVQRRTATALPSATNSPPNVASSPETNRTTPLPPRSPYPLQGTSGDAMLQRTEVTGLRPLPEHSLPHETRPAPTPAPLTQRATARASESELSPVRRQANTAGAHGLPVPDGSSSTSAQTRPPQFQAPIITRAARKPASPHPHQQDSASPPAEETSPKRDTKSLASGTLAAGDVHRIPETASVPSQAREASVIPTPRTRVLPSKTAVPGALPLLQNVSTQAFTFTDAASPATPVSRKRDAPPADTGSGVTPDLTERAEVLQRRRIPAGNDAEAAVLQHIEHAPVTATPPVSKTMSENSIPSAAAESSPENMGRTLPVQPAQALPSFIQRSPAADRSFRSEHTASAYASGPAPQPTQRQGARSTVGQAENVPVQIFASPVSAAFSRVPDLLVEPAAPLPHSHPGYMAHPLAAFSAIKDPAQPPTTQAQASRRVPMARSALVKGLPPATDPPTATIHRTTPAGRPAVPSSNPSSSFSLMPSAVQRSTAAPHEMGMDVPPARAPMLPAIAATSPHTAIDLPQLANQVYGLLVRRLASERQRKEA